MEDSAIKKKENRMGRFFKRTGKKAAQSPGTLTHVGERRMDKVSIQKIAYDSAHLEEAQMENLDSFRFQKDFHGVIWLNMVGIHDTAVVERAGNIFDIHSLVLEDILNTFHRPKIEDYGDYVFLVLKMLYYDQNEREVISEQVSLVVGKNFVVTFQEREGDVFQPVRDRIQKGKGRIRNLGSDYLLYALVDAVVDHYFFIMEEIGEDIEELETQLLNDPKPSVLKSIQKLRKELIFLRKAVWPLREVVNTLLRGDSSLVKKNTLMFIRDVYDHTIQVIDTTETCRDLVSGLQDLYLSSISNRMNQVMKVLTIIATIFIPLTFIAGIYGMNFEVMPELKWKFGYYFTWVIMLVVGAGMVVYFKRNKWL